ncbi:hypothetical protein [Flavobacterium suzhouense]|uniref:Uncharacterized protein n=1 Tax=Flavobacterium suzhouense TaxID=1529638 RepID=A0ABW5NR71_9FLAO
MRTPALLTFLLLFIFSEAKAQHQYENIASITEYLDQSGLEYDKKDIAVFSIFDAWVKAMKIDKKNEFPDVFFFNTEGKSVKLRGYLCSQTINNIENIGKSKVNKKEEDADWWFTYMTYAEEDPNRFVKPYDGYIIIAWTKMVPKEMNETAFKWYTSVKKKNNPNIKVFLLSFDIMDFWEISDANKKALGL